VSTQDLRLAPPTIRVGVHPLLRWPALIDKKAHERPTKDPTAFATRGSYRTAPAAQTKHARAAMTLIVPDQDHLISDLLDERGHALSGSLTQAEALALARAVARLPEIMPAP
jgi:hypothetical protein